eukprot:CAMPEP_0173319366 /NCGR_PEP_ID=MMETSP1143-20121109/28183_1 /TAXON_ID=483371 /ORGANISM="non described non described, Strain CCMP2298" /LENGTH=122 /DNA_ID=CAMNT_0014262735 /DNA_START=410 /DNA_END=778 /DNA_ORIENTATION=-
MLASSSLSFESCSEKSSLWYTSTPSPFLPPTPLPASVFSPVRSKKVCNLALKCAASARALSSFSCEGTTTALAMGSPIALSRSSRVRVGTASERFWRVVLGNRRVVRSSQAPAAWWIAPKSD